MNYFFDNNYSCFIDINCENNYNKDDKLPG